METHPEEFCPRCRRWMCICPDTRFPWGVFFALCVLAAGLAVGFALGWSAGSIAGGPLS